MGKNKKSKIVYNGLELDSKEELDFIYWLEEATEHNLVSKYSYQPCEYSLFDKEVLIQEQMKKDKICNKEFTLLNSHIYTPDFSVCFTLKFKELCAVHGWNKVFKILDIDAENIIDVKGMFNQSGGDRVFAINQKWVYQKYHVFIHKIIPEKLFNATWCPQKCRLTVVKKQVIEKYKDLKNITEILMKG
jgi:hypothetical protein